MRHHLALLALAAALAGCASAGKPAANTDNAVVHHVSAQDQAATHATTPITADRVTLWVNGLGCPLCATNADKQLKRLPGVLAVDTDLSTGKILVQLGTSRRPSPEQFSGAIADAGFTLVKIETH
ncbi:MAG: heavy-metal-associated domain-containing protein [Phycisphaerae bacterium]|nr:heavy-metal-associated domain-containing protein [Phycisphaerae bacterium]